MHQHKFVVYTAIADNFDLLRPVPKVAQKVGRFVCFGHLGCEKLGWEYRPLPKVSESSRMQCRLVKIRPDLYLSEHSVSLWIDANISFSKAIVELMEGFASSGDDVWVSPHPTRKSVQEEVTACLRLGKETDAGVDGLYSHLLRKGFQDNVGLSETNVLFRRHLRPDVVEAMQIWGDFIWTRSIRDQLSFDFVCDYSGLNVKRFSQHVHGKHKVFRRGLHVKNRGICGRLFCEIERLQGLLPALPTLVSNLYCLRKRLLSSNFY